MKVTIDIPQKEESAYREKNKVIKKAEDVFELEEVQTIKNSTKEHLLFIGLDIRNHIKSINILAIGKSNMVIGDYKDIAQTALINSCDKVILVHNHPSDSLEASEQDKLMSLAMYNLLEFHKILLLDHIIVSNKGFHSMNKELKNDYYGHKNNELELLEKASILLENKKLKDEIKEIQEKYKLKNENNLPKDYEKTDEISMDFTEKDGENLEKVLINMNKNIEMLDEMWNKIPYTIREQLDVQFNEGFSPSYCLRWLQSGINSIVQDFNNFFIDLKQTLEKEESEAEI